jgi:hypothetical protein
MEVLSRRLLDLSRITGTIGFVIALATPTASYAVEIKVLTSRAMNHVLTELAGAFQRTSEHKVVLILAPPAEIRRRIINGEIVDVAMSGDAIIGDLMQQGKIARDSKVTLARVGIGVAVRTGSAKPGIASVEGFKHALLAARCLYGPGSRRSERHPFREGSRSPGYRQRDQSQVDSKRPGGDHAQCRSCGTRRGRPRHPTDQRNRVGPRRRVVRSPTGRAAIHDRDFDGNKRAGRRQGAVPIPDFACRSSGHQGDRHGAGLVKSDPSSLEHRWVGGPLRDQTSRLAWPG